MPNVSISSLRVSIPKYVLGVTVFIVVMLLILLLQAIYVDLRHAPERQARAFVRQQIESIKAGSQAHIFVSNEISNAAIDEFVTARNEFKNVKPFTLEIEYSQNTDDFLKQIAGLPNVRELFLGQNDVTDPGMQYVATLPDLESLSLHEVFIGDAGLKNLATSSRLKRLVFAPREGTKVTIDALLALPRLRSLVVHEPYEDDWLKRNITHFEKAHSLDELTLVGEFSFEEIQSLREKLPNCKIEAQRGGK